MLQEYLVDGSSPKNHARVTRRSRIAGVIVTTLSVAIFGLFIFGVFKTRRNQDLVILRNWTTDGLAWSGWDMVEAGLRPEEGTPADYPLDVAAGIFEGRIYIASRWASPPPDQEHEEHYYVAVNFSEDGDDWSEWRIPQSDVSVEPSGSPGLAAVDNHFYLFAPRLFRNTGETTRVWAY